MKKWNFQFVGVTILLSLLLAACSQGMIESATKTGASPADTIPATSSLTPASSLTEPDRENSPVLPTNPPQTQTSADNPAAATQSELATETPGNNQPPGASQNTPEPDYIQAAIQNLMIQFNLSREMIEVQTIEEVEWPDAGLGCPLPGADYAQILTPGYLVTLEALDLTYTYHTDTDIHVILCSDDGHPILPNIPISTDEEIMDGIPWVPVE